MTVEHLAPPWQPGQSGNAGGAGIMARSLAAYARKRTRDGRALVDFMLDVMQGKPLPLKSTRSNKPSRSRYPQTPKVEHRLVAAQWLADRGWGKAKELIELSGDSTTTAEQRLALLRRLSDDERETLRGLLAKALATADAPPSDFDARPAAVDLEDQALEAAAPAELGRPRNVSRAIAPDVAELGDVEVPQDHPAGPESPPDPTADGVTPPPHSVE